MGKEFDFETFKAQALEQKKPVSHLAAKMGLWPRFWSIY